MNNKPLDDFEEGYSTGYREGFSAGNQLGYDPEVKQEHHRIFYIGYREGVIHILIVLLCCVLACVLYLIW